MRKATATSRKTPRELKVLHQLVDEVPNTEFGAARRYLEYLRNMGDPVLRKFRDAPLDDEPETPEEARRVAASKRDIKSTTLARTAD